MQRFPSEADTSRGGGAPSACGHTAAACHMWYTLPTCCMQHPNNSTSAAPACCVWTHCSCVVSNACAGLRACQATPVTPHHTAAGILSLPILLNKQKRCCWRLPRPHSCDRMPLHSSTLSFPVQVFPARPAVLHAHTQQGSATARLNRHFRRQNLTRFYKPAAQ